VDISKRQTLLPVPRSQNQSVDVLFFFQAGSECIDAKPGIQRLGMDLKIDQLKLLSCGYCLRASPGHKDSIAGLCINIT
jgi:hypothetical protein